MIERNCSLKRIANSLRIRFINIIFNKTFSLWERLGFHVTMNRYDMPIPDTRALKDELWQRHSNLIGINMNEARQLQLLSDLASRFKGEYDKLPLTNSEISHPYDYYIKNNSFGSVDGEILYSMVRFFKPKNIFEIGSGNSTYLSAKAVLENKKDGGDECELVVFDPYPNDILRRGFPGLSRLIPARVQDAQLTEFEKLEENDILFIDSSHVLTIGGDVQYEYLEMLPRLKRGVVVHIHDIFLPLEYPKRWVLKDHRFWTEQYLLQAFLAFNGSFEVLWAASFMHSKYPDKLRGAFKSYTSEKEWPSSFWIRRIR